MIRKYVSLATVAIASSALGAFLYSVVAQQPDQTQASVPTISIPPPTHNVLNIGAEMSTDFTEAAERTVNGVVHVMVCQTRRRSSPYDDIFGYFFGQPQPSQQKPEVAGSGSGVIISSDGYIVTNNHVVKDGDLIEVVLNDKRSFEATVVGTDPTTDIALLKIEATGLAPLTFANSDAVKVGEWVLAVGNPFNLTSTVTAGIVSAKSRSMGINVEDMAIESFIQTDAAVNPGNSGGALVNTRGELVGINTAIASTTGSFTGYSFAVPSNIAQKVAADLRAYGRVQRALLGIYTSELNTQLQKQTGLENLDGVYVAGVTDSGAAKSAGIEEGDVILSINGNKTNTVAELQGIIGQHRPGDNVEVLVWRNGKKQTFVVTMRNLHGGTDVVKEDAADELLGATFETLSPNELNSLRLRCGIKIRNVGKGKLQQANVRNGYIITKANGVLINNVQDLKRVAASASEGLFLTGCYPDGRVAYYAVNLQD